MPRDNDKDNDSRGRRDRPSGGKGRSGAARGPEKKFAKRGFAGKSDSKPDGERRPYAGKSDGARSYGKKPYSPSAKSSGGKPYGGDRGARPPRFSRDDRPRGDRPFADRPSRSGDGEKRTFKPRDRDRNSGPGDRGDARPAARFSDRKFGDKKPYASRDGGEKRPYTPRGDRPERKFGGDKK